MLAVNASRGDGCQGVAAIQIYQAFGDRGDRTSEFRACLKIFSCIFIEIDYSWS